MARSQDEIMHHLRNRTPLDQVRVVFSGACGRIEQAGMQRIPLSPVEMRGMELDAVEKIIARAVEVGLVCPSPQKEGEECPPADGRPR